MKEKHCHSCNRTLSVDKFGSNKSKKDGLASQCKKCRKDYQSSWYVKNKSLHLSRIAKNKKKHKEIILNYLWEILSKSSCPCGEHDPVVLDFHHRERECKEFGISRSVRLGVSLDKLKKEIEKCDILCSNCHRRETAKEMDWWIYRKSIEDVDE